MASLASCDLMFAKSRILCYTETSTDSEKE